MKIVKEIIDRRLRRRCVKMALDKATYLDDEIITKAAIFEYYIKNGANNVPALVQFEDLITYRNAP